MIDFDKFDKAVIITGDGDFYCLVNYLKEKRKLKNVIVPNRFKYSNLLKKSAEGYLADFNDLRNKLEYKK